MDGVKGANHNTRLAFEGVVAFPVTPFRGDLTLDVEGLRRNVRALLREAPPCAIVAAGGTGELYSLTPDEHLEVVRTVVEAAAGVPVIAGVGFNAAMAVPMAAASERAGAAGILAFPPVLPERGRERPRGVLPGDRRRLAATGDLQPRLVPSGPGARRAAGGHSDAGRVEGRTGGHPAASGAHGRGRVAARLGRWRRRRSGSGLLRGRHPRVHVERVERRAAAIP